MGVITDETGDPLQDELGSPIYDEGGPPGVLLAIGPCVRALWKNTLDSDRVDIYPAQF